MHIFLQNSSKGKSQCLPLVGGRSTCRETAFSAFPVVCELLTTLFWKLSAIHLQNSYAPRRLQHAGRSETISMSSLLCNNYHMTFKVILQVSTITCVYLHSLTFVIWLSITTVNWYTCFSVFIFPLWTFSQTFTSQIFLVPNIKTSECNHCGFYLIILYWSNIPPRTLFYLQRHVCTLYTVHTVLPALNPLIRDIINIPNKRFSFKKSPCTKAKPITFHAATLRSQKFFSLIFYWTFTML